MSTCVTFQKKSFLWGLYAHIHRHKRKTQEFLLRKLYYFLLLTLTKNNKKIVGGGAIDIILQKHVMHVYLIFIFFFLTKKKVEKVYTEAREEEFFEWTVAGEDMTKYTAWMVVVMTMMIIHSNNNINDYNGKCVGDGNDEDTPDIIERMYHFCNYLSYFSPFLSSLLSFFRLPFTVPFFLYFSFLHQHRYRHSVYYIF